MDQGRRKAALYLVSEEAEASSWYKPKNSNDPPLLVKSTDCLYFFTNYSVSLYFSFLLDKTYKDSQLQNYLHLTDSIHSITKTKGRI